MSIRVRDARPGDEAAVVGLIRELASSAGGSTPITEEFVHSYLRQPWGKVILAERGDQAVGLLSYSTRLDLYHAGLTCLIEELVVRAAVRRQGIGSALVSELLDRMVALGCVEMSVATLVDNVEAKDFYRSHGLVDDAVLLERHLDLQAPCPR